MPTLEWWVPFTIQAPFGTLSLNGPENERRYVVNPRKSFGRRTFRVTTDPIPQGDGEIFHDRWANGYEMQLAVQLWDGGEPACDAALCEMRDELYGILYSLLRPRSDGGRVFWTPSCGGERMLDAAHLLSLSDPEFVASEDGAEATEISFVLDSPFPYAISHLQTTESINGGGTAGNAGNVEFWPVILVQSPGAAFTITNNDLGLSIVYSGVSIGGGDYAEIDTFRGTIYLNGDQDNLKPGINPLQTDFFPIEPGGNSITTSDPCDFLLNDAFA